MATEVVSPKVVLDRYVAVTGTEVDPSTFGLDAVVMHGMMAPRFDSSGIVLQGGNKTFMAPISQYDPAQDRWLLSDELVRPNEQPALATHLATELYPLARRMMMLPAIAAGAVTFDAQHPRTRSVRQELERQVRPLDPKSWLGRTGVAAQLDRGGHLPGELVSADDFTIAYPALGIVVESTPNGLPTFRRNGALTMQYAGVTITNDALERPGYTVRSTRTLTLALRDADDPTVWRPNWEVLSRPEWEALRPTAAIMEEAAAADERFSPFFAMVVHNQPEQP
jgi:hypothetical protein